MDDPSHDASQGSVTQWIADLREGDDSAAQRELWERYFGRLVGLARTQLGALPKAHADEEDVALSAMHSLFHGFARDRFPDLCDRHNLWSLLAKITARKAIDQRQKEGAQKRGGGWARLGIGPGGSGPGSRGSTGEESQAAYDPADDDLGPEFVVSMQEEVARLLAQLPDDTLRLVALRKLEGCTSSEIAAELGVVERTIERKLGLIRACWSPSEA